MKYMWRKFLGKCTCCGQNLKTMKPANKRVAELNNRSSRLAKSLGRWPLVQSCKKCGKMVLEGEPGFVLSFLLIDLELDFSQNHFKRYHSDKVPVQSL